MSDTKQINYLLAGVGGQGIILASKILAQCAIESGMHVMSAETIGMAQRGGCVVSHVRAGEAIYSPMIPMGKADVILAFEPGEGVRVLPYLKYGGTLVTAQKTIKPVTASLSGDNYNASDMLCYLKKQDIKLVMLDGDKVLNKCGSSRVLNIALLGAAMGAGALGFDKSAAEKAVKSRVKPQFAQLNLKALQIGCDLGEVYKK